MIKNQDTIFALEHEGEKKITVVTIRESIVFLLLKLLALDMIAIIFVLIFFSPFLIPIAVETKLQLVSYNFAYFSVLAFIKIFLTTFIILRWLNDNYEITPEVLIHKRGIIWQKEERYKLVHVKSFGLEQGILGKIFNYGTLRFYDWFLRKDYAIYLIHNPRKYLRILEDLLPYSDEIKATLREHFIEPEEEEPRNFWLAKVTPRTRLS